jgi:hypothetical protein
MTYYKLSKLNILLIGPFFIITLGCSDEPSNLSPGQNQQSLTQAPSDSNKPVLRKVIGQKTQNVLNLQEEVKNNPGEGHISDLKITAKDPITLQGNAYVTAIGKISVGQIDYAIKLFQAQEDRFPADYEEFMQRIIKDNNIELPQLPGYQEYAYDEQNHKLVVLEYPDRKEALKGQVRGEKP